MWNIVDFLSMHGIGHAIATKVKAVRIFWCTILIACISFATYFLYQLFTDYLKYETDWTVTEHVNSSIYFPVVTMCNGLRRHHINKTENVSLFTDGFASYANKSERFCRFDHGSCSKTSYSHKVNEPSCLVFNKDESLQQRMPFITAGLAVEFFLNKSDISIKDESKLEFIDRMEAVRVYFHTKDIFLELYNSHVTAKLGFSTIFVIKKVKFSRAKFPYPSKCTNDESQQLNFYPGNYTQQGCLGTKFNHDNYLKCGYVSDSIKPYFPFENYRKVEFNQTCLESLKFDPSSTSCNMPCYEVRFEIKAQSETRWPLEPKLSRLRETVSNIFKFNVSNEYIYSHFGKVLIAYDALDVVHYEEKPKYNTQKVLSDFGGLIGIYLGASLISMVEIFIVCGRLLVKAFSKDKKKSIAVKMEQSQSRSNSAIESYNQSQPNESI